MPLPEKLKHKLLMPENFDALRVALGPRVQLASCKSALNPPVVYSPF